MRSDRDLRTWCCPVYGTSHPVDEPQHLCVRDLQTVCAAEQTAQNRLLGWLLKSRCPQARQLCLLMKRLKLSGTVGCLEPIASRTSTGASSLVSTMARFRKSHSLHTAAATAGTLVTAAQGGGADGQLHKRACSNRSLQPPCNDFDDQATLPTHLG